jgi:hypothetical protein
LVLIGLGVVLPGCSGRALRSGEARLAASGRVQVATQAEDWRTSSGGTLRSGDKVRVLDGSARLQFPGDRTVELRPGSAIQVGAKPVVLGGDVLVTVANEPLTVSLPATDAKVSGGSARMQRGPSAVVASYSGAVDLDSAGRTLHVPALRQAVITAAGLIPNKPAPLAYDARDGWDRRFLGDAIDLGADLLARSRGFTAQLAPTEGHTAGFYRQLIPGLDGQPAFSQTLLDDARSPGETLVGAAIAADGHTGDFTDRWNEVFRFRDEGAAWGLVALDQQVGRVPLLTDIDDAIGRANTVFATPALVAAAAPVQATPVTAPAPTATTAATTTTARPATRPTTTTTPTTPPAGAPLGPPLAQPGNGLLDTTVNGLLDTVGGLLGGKTQGK